MSSCRFSRHAFGVAAAAIVTIGVSSAATANPDLLGAWESGDGVGLMWSNGDNNVASFRVYRREGASAPWQYLHPVAFAGALYEYTDTPVPRGQELCYRIGARISGQSGIRMSNQRCVTPANLPVRPASVRLNPVASRSVTIAWSDASTNETGFSVERKRWGVDASWRAVHSTSAATGTGTRFEFEDTGVAMEYRTCYRVGARSSANTTIWSSIQCADVPGWAMGPSPTVPLALSKIASPGTGQIRIEWLTSLSGAKYKVSRYDPIDGARITVATIRDQTPGAPNSRMSFTDSGLDPSRVYCYSVATTNVVSESLCTSAFDRSGGDAPAPPTLAVTPLGNKALDYEWTVPDDALGTFSVIYALEDRVARVIFPSLTTGPGSYSATIGSLERNTRYCMMAVSYNRSGIAVSDRPCVNTLNILPPVPRNLRVGFNTNERVNYRWNNSPGENEDSYELRWTGRRAGMPDDDGDADRPGRANTFYDLFGIAGYLYCVQVRSRNEVGASAWSNEVCAVAAPANEEEPPPSYWACGLSCPDGYHSEAQQDHLGCPNAWPAGATLCVENEPNFRQCGLVCPDGYHATQLGFRSSCAVWADPASLNNEAVCAKNQGTFQMCGTECPDGWNDVDSGTASFCKTTDVAPRDWVTCFPE